MRTAAITFNALARAFAAGAAALLALPPAAGAEGLQTSLDAAVLSDYRWRGISLSEERPSLQLALGLESGGLAVSAMANSVSENEGGLELGLAADWTHSTALLDWTFGAAAYAYPEAPEINYFQLNGSLARTFGALSLSAGLEYTPKQGQLASEDRYYWGAGEVSLSERVALHAQIGRDEGAYASKPGALDASAGVRVAVNPFQFDLTYVESDSDGPAWVLGAAYSIALTSGAAARP